MSTAKLKAIDVVFEVIPDRADHSIQDIKIRFDVSKEQVDKIFSILTAHPPAQAEGEKPELCAGCGSEGPLHARWCKYQ